MKNRIIAVDISPEDLAFADTLDDVFYYLPKRTWIYMPYTAVPLYELGFSPERIDELRRGTQPTNDEENIVQLAVDLTRTVSEAVRLKDTKKELDLIIEASEVAQKLFNDNERARRVLRALRKLITDMPVVDYYTKRQDEIINEILQQK